MNGREYYHESVVRDIVDIVTSLKDYDEVQFLSNVGSHRSFKSISSATKDIILTFPMLAGSDMDPANVCMAAKAHEKKCAAMLHMLFTAICVKSNEDVFDYVQKFHSNIGSLNNSLEDYTDALDRMASNLNESDESFIIDKNIVNAVLEDLKQSNYVLPDDIKEESLSEYKIIPGYTIGTDDIIIKEAKGGSGTSSSGSPSSGVTVGIGRSNNKPKDDSKSKNKSKSYSSSFKTDSALDLSKRLDAEYKMMRNTVLDGEYKKANELMPTMMVVNFMKKNDNAVSTATTAVIGIKVKVYPVTTTDICQRISSKVEDKNVLNSFIRATTNEIGFFKDFLFAIDKAKIDAMSYGSKTASSNKLWKVLERRTIKSKFRRSLKMTNDATAITTLCLSDNTVKELRESYNIDLENVSVANKILDSYNFMCICILNESIETAQFLYDTGDDNYEKLTFSNLEREAGDNSYKKMVNLLTKMTR